MIKIPDLPQRQQALDPKQSFIVQAPAGSGKTELLTQRFLVLLARVEKPEEVIALTFTRKAAAEMRARILQALHNASNPEPEAKHAKQTWQLARAALAQDQHCQWDLINNPNRLRIQTIDSLCASLTQQMPILSKFGATPNVVENAQEYYLEASRELLQSLQHDTPWQEHLEKLLEHLDNDYNKIETLCTDMLARRDQWLRYMLGIEDTTSLRIQLEAGLNNIINESLIACQQAMPRERYNEIQGLLQFASNNLHLEGSHSKIVNCLEHDDITRWHGIAELLLTKEGEWRKSVSKRTGFPAGAQYKENKQAMLELLAALQEQDALRLHLQNLLTCPPAEYNEQQWQIIKTLTSLLPILAAQLTLVFKRHGLVDFTEISSAANVALGDADNPTDLALALDYQIKHLLIDEFQDTSLPQFHLLERLTAGWQTGDARTLFVVGDPMQSIYRFREAEVGLFLRAKREGIGHVNLESLTLCSNFRSEQGIVDWVNQTFSLALPKEEDIASGAVSYNPSTAINENTLQQSVALHAVGNESLQVTAIINNIREQHPHDSIAILVKARTHLLEILPRLKHAGIAYQAIEIEPLAYRPVVQDLFALTRALLHLADRAAWLAILRAPWCGLTLADLHIIAGDNHQACLWDAIIDKERYQRLSEDGQARLQRFADVLAQSIQQRGRTNLRPWIEQTWLRLGGPACLERQSDLDDAQAYFKLLQKLSLTNQVIDFACIEQHLQRLFAKSEQQSDHQLQVMTIHKSKGLEFDHVLLPSLERSAPINKSPLLMWMERPRQHGGDDLILAPIKAIEQDSDPIFNYLRQQESKKDRFETGRLLYVAATRAKKSLHLLASLTKKDNGEIKRPAGSSLLAAIVEVFIKDAQKSSAIDVDIEEESRRYSLRRLTSNWQHPIVTAYSVNDQTNHYHPRLAVWHKENNRHIGTVIHRLLKVLAEQGIKNLAMDRLESHCRASLLECGVVKGDLGDCVAKVKAAIDNIISDTKGQWILDNSHQQARAEYPLSVSIENVIQQIIIDRTFIDESGTRWIIDYKTSMPDNESIEQFITREKKAYKPQLEKYAAAFRLSDERPIKCGLYFPMIARFCEM